MSTHESRDFADKLVFGFDVVFGGFEYFFTFGFLSLVSMAVVEYDFLEFLNDGASSFDGFSEVLVL